MTVNAPQLAYQAGDLIAGKYALEALLGSGGMGAVFRARNTTLDLPVALKLIRADLDRDKFSHRLLQEARAAAKLAHPAIVRGFDIGQTALGDPFIVMELLEGETLSELVDREGPLSSERAVQLLLPIAEGLSTAHAKGFVHRDVKPDNVFLSRSADGHLQPKLVDFGIVKHEDLRAEPQTQAGLVVGSPDYMSPEQARGRTDLDLRSDVWSLCVVLYEVIAGTPPCAADNYNALMRLIVETDPVSLRELGKADDALSAIVAKGLEKTPAARWSSLGQLGKALAIWLLDRGVGEDACGASLDSRWLSRGAEGAATRLSSPSLAPAPPPTSVDAAALGSALTVVSRTASAPQPRAPTSGDARRPTLVASRRDVRRGGGGGDVRRAPALRGASTAPRFSGHARRFSRTGGAPSPGVERAAAARSLAAPGPAIRCHVPSCRRGRGEHAEPGRPASEHPARS